MMNSEKLFVIYPILKLTGNDQDKGWRSGQVVIKPAPTWKGCQVYIS
jgi:hypothetical protein